MREDRGALDKRKAYILATVVYEYIATAEPVGSQTLTQKYHLGVSSATVRNEMAELEAGGYLVQPHTSSGRIPSDAGYRTYVDQLMEPEQLGSEDRRRIRDELHDASRQLDDIIDSTTRLLGRLSNNLAFVTKPHQEAQTFRHVQLIWLTPRTGVAIVVTSLGVAAQSLFELAADMRADDLTRFSNALNARFANRSMREVSDSDVRQVAEEIGAHEDLRGAVLTALQSARETVQPNIASAGAQNLLDQPEFQDLRKLRSILRIVEEQKTLYQIVADAMNSEAPSVMIGHELGSEELADLSVVTVPYRFGQHALGMLSILGPRRMPYGRLVALASGTAESLSERLSDLPS
ncbi:MAG: heat-inducible transcription repressor HrcA [Candidatus Eremiobacteraeota bacterium]|nr:heat-inducible transcription repressor HrcA [Candidatus Eremiobacteraeota bacterium]MBV8372522.1 heat-inducible transcription repressor HrcA [Candidatus Eremiobacteraeota bacterium]